MKEYIVAIKELALGFKATDMREELIRCKDCKHHRYENNKIPYCNWIDYGYGWEDNDFCSRAERRE